MSEILFGIISIVITAAIIGTTKLIVRSKLKNLHGSYKIIAGVTILAITAEIVYLSTSSGLLQFAFEAIASIGVGIILLGITFQNKLRNAAAGISISLSTRVNEGDTIEIGNKVGVIKEIRLTKTVVTLKNGNEMWIPNAKFDEEVVITHKGN